MAKWKILVKNDKGNLVESIDCRYYEVVNSNEILYAIDGEAETRVLMPGAATVYIYAVGVEPPKGKT